VLGVVVVKNNTKKRGWCLSFHDGKREERKERSVGDGWRWFGHEPVVIRD
jgi:hypothetical protein